MTSGIRTAEWNIFWVKISPNLINRCCTHNRFTVSDPAIVFGCFPVHQAKLLLKVQYPLSLQERQSQP
jgi:hypothetical protein